MALSYPDTVPMTLRSRDVGNELGCTVIGRSANNQNICIVSIVSIALFYA